MFSGGQRKAGFKKRRAVVEIAFCRLKERAELPMESAGERGLSIVGLLLSCVPTQVPDEEETLGLGTRRPNSLTKAGRLGTRCCPRLRQGCSREAARGEETPCPPFHGRESQPHEFAEKLRVCILRLGTEARGAART